MLSTELSHPMFTRRAEIALALTLAAASLVAAAVVVTLPGADGSAVSAAVPLLWAGLFLYLPVRLAARAVWRQVRHVAPDADDRRPLLAVLLLGIGLMVWGIDWGLAGDLWAPDELRPDLVRGIIDARLSNGWYDKYPLMHYAVLAVPISAFELAARVGLPSSDPVTLFAAQLAAMRLVSVVLGQGALAAAFLCGVELGGPRRAWLASLALLLTPPTLFYGKLANLDIPALCWFGFALLCFLRIVRRGRPVDYVGLGIAAAAAVATKDQFYANLALLPFGVVVATARHRQPRTWWRALPAAAIDRRILLGAGAAAVGFAVFNNAVFNFRGLVDHFALLSTLGDLAIAPRTPAGVLSLTATTGRLFLLALGWPLLLLAVAGVGAAIASPERRWWLWLLLVPLGFNLTFTAVTLYVNDRYLFGGIFVLALFAGSALADLLDSRRWPVPAHTVAVVAVLVSLLYASSINVMMNLDARDAARRFVTDTMAGDTRVGLVGGYTPYLPPPVNLVEMEETSASVASVQPDWIIVNARFARRFQTARSPEGRELLAALEDGSLGYVEVFRRRTPLPFWALLQYHPAFVGPAESPLTNLDKVNPETVVYRHAR